MRFLLGNTTFRLDCRIRAIIERGKFIEIFLNFLGSKPNIIKFIYYWTVHHLSWWFKMLVIFQFWEVSKANIEVYYALR